MDTQQKMAFLDHVNATQADRIVQLQRQIQEQGEFIGILRREMAKRAFDVTYQSEPPPCWPPVPTRMEGYS